MNLESTETVAMTDADGESNQAGLPTDNVVEKENLLLSKGDFPSFMFQTIYVNYKIILVFSVRFLMFYKYIYIIIKSIKSYLYTYTV